jgi:hypothetical protein
MSAQRTVQMFRHIVYQKFFFEKKNQKTFARAVAGLSCEVCDSASKSFLLLFLKKEESYPRSRSTSRAALCPGAPVTPPPGCVPDPH